MRKTAEPRERTALAELNPSREQTAMKPRMRPNILNRPAPVSIVVAIPVRNESERITGCLDALANTVEIPNAGLGILLFVNNCTDDTRAVIDAWACRAPWPLCIVENDSASASAGWARREAMEAAAGWLEQADAHNGLLLTTDADSRVPPAWVASNAAAIAAGADAVAGRVAFDGNELISLSEDLRERHRLVHEYESLLAEIEARLDPRRGNPWPCHWTKSGASIAVTLPAYRLVGGMPPVSSGEDHAFIDRIAAYGLVVRHAQDIVVTTSSRLDGRAQGGTAETLKTWSVDPSSPCDPRLERVGAFILRILRRRWRLGGTPVERRPPPGRLLRPRELPGQIQRARFMLRLIRSLEARRAGMTPFAAGLSPETTERMRLP